MFRSLSVIFRELFFSIHQHNPATTVYTLMLYTILNLLPMSTIVTLWLKFLRQNFTISLKLFNTRLDYPCCQYLKFGG
jgi:hypothetical protein